MDTNDSVYVVSRIFIIGNKVTKENILLKELTFKEGDSVSAENLLKETGRSRENLLNTSLFNFVNIYWYVTDYPEIHVFISVIERWYIWPSVIFEHAERNLGAFIHEPDWRRINYGGQVQWYNFRGRREELKLKLRFGYKEQLEILYNKPNSGKDQKHGVLLAFNQTRQHEVHILTENNKPVYLRNDDSFLAEIFNPYIAYSCRNSLYSKHFLVFSYFGLRYRDSASHEYFTGLSYGQKSASVIAEYSYEYDLRDSKPYPLRGEYFRLSLKRRQSVLARNPSGSESSAKLTASHHGALSNRFYYNNSLRLSFSKDVYEPMVFRTGLGFGSYLRGYELNVIEGNSYAFMVNNLKYCLLKERSYDLSFIPWSQFNPLHFSIYANLFFDMAYVHGKYYKTEGNTYVDRLLYTGGLGIDLVSYYDQVLRFELSLNREGQTGFFIHSEIPFGR